MYVTYTDDDGSLNKETFYRAEAARQQAIKPVNDRLDEIKPKNLDKSLRPHGHEPPRTDNQHRDRRSPHLLLLGASPAEPRETATRSFSRLPFPHHPCVAGI